MAEVLSSQAGPEATRQHSSNQPAGLDAFNVQERGGSSSPNGYGMLPGLPNMLASPKAAKQPDSEDPFTLADRCSIPGAQQPLQHPQAQQQQPQAAYPQATTCQAAEGPVHNSSQPALSGAQPALRRSNRERRGTRHSWYEEGRSASPAPAAVAAVRAPSGLAPDQDFSGLLLLIETAAALSTAGDEGADSAAVAGAAVPGHNSASPATVVHADTAVVGLNCEPDDTAAHELCSLQEEHTAASMAALAIHQLSVAQTELAPPGRSRPRKPNKTGGISLTAVLAAAAAAQEYQLENSGSSGLPPAGPGGIGGKPRKFMRLDDMPATPAAAAAGMAGSSSNKASSSAKPRKSNTSGSSARPGTSNKQPFSSTARRMNAAVANGCPAITPADGTGSLPNLKPRGQGRWQVFLCAQGLKYLYVGQYENLPEAKHARDLAVLAVHGPSLVPTLEPIENYCDEDVAAVRVQMAEKPAARAVMVQNGLWPPEGASADAMVLQQPRSKRLPGLQHTLQMIHEKHQAAKRAERKANAHGSSSSCRQAAGLAPAPAAAADGAGTGSSSSSGAADASAATTEAKFDAVFAAASLATPGGSRSRSPAPVSTAAGVEGSEQQAAGATVAAGRSRRTPRARSKDTPPPATAAAVAARAAVDPLPLEQVPEVESAAAEAAAPVPEAEVAAAAAAAAPTAVQAVALATVAAEFQAALEVAVAAAAAAEAATPAAEVQPVSAKSSAAAISTRNTRCSSNGTAVTAPPAPAVAATLQHYHARATANPTGTTGIREHKGVFEVFLATPPFKYLYVGRANSLADARRMKATAMMAIYGAEVAAEQFGAEAEGIGPEDVRSMAVKLSSKPAALAAMKSYGTDAVLTEQEQAAAAAASSRASAAAQQQLAQVQVQLQLQAQQQQQQQQRYHQQQKRSNRRQQRMQDLQQQQQLAVSQDMLGAAVDAAAAAAAAIAHVPEYLPSVNTAAVAPLTAADMTGETAADTAGTPVGSLRRSSRKRSAAAAFRLEQAIFGNSLAEADKAASASDLSDPGTPTTAAASALKRRRNTTAAIPAEQQQQQHLLHTHQMDPQNSCSMSAAGTAAAVLAAAAVPGQDDAELADCQLQQQHLTAAAQVAHACQTTSEASGMRSSVDGEVSLTIYAPGSLSSKDAKVAAVAVGNGGAFAADAFITRAAAADSGAGGLLDMAAELAFMQQQLLQQQQQGWGMSATGAGVAAGEDATAA